MRWQSDIRKIESPPRPGAKSGPLSYEARFVHPTKVDENGEPVIVTMIAATRFGAQVWLRRQKAGEK